MYHSKIHNSLDVFNFSYCEAFPAIKSAIERVMREQDRVKKKNEEKKSSKSSSKSGLVSKVKSDVAVSTGTSSTSFTLQRRQSTATSVKYDMYLMNLGTMLNLFGSSSDRKKNFHYCHQILLKEGKLTRFEDLPLGAFVMFISHQWNSFNHPDPDGYQIRVLCKLLRDLRDGVHGTVSTDPFHVLLYDEDTRTHKSEWQTLLSNAYVWYVVRLSVSTTLIFSN